MKRLLADHVSVGALVLLLTTSAAFAQATAELSGTVRDESGAVLPGVTVTVTQTGTGLTRTVVTDGNGGYVIPNLPTGPYSLEGSLQGFRTYVQTGIVLQVGASPVVNPTLAVGSLEETVSVEAAAPLVDVRSAGVSAVVENERIVELPLQGRQVTDLLVLAGAAVQTAEATNRTVPGGVRISVAGGLPTGVGYTLDGATHTNPQENVNLPMPFPDALQEFRVSTSGLSAQHGFHSAASVNAVTKSGTNRFSGNGFEFLRHHRLNAASPFARIEADGTRADDGLKRHQFGGTLGGPVMRDRLFFFAGYQATVVRERPASNIAFVPTAQMIAGDLTTFASPQCNGGRQVTLRAPYVNNRIDPAQFSPAALNLVRRLPATADPCGQITFDVRSDRDEKQTIVRGDYQMGASQSLFGRYFVTRFTREPGYAGEGDNILGTVNQGADAWSHSTTFGSTSVFGANMVNALRVAINVGSVDNYQNPFFSPADLGARVHSYDPGYMVVTVTGGFDLYPSNQARAAFYNDTYEVTNDLNVVRGNHQLAFGGHVQYWKGDYTSTSRANGNWQFDGSATGLGLADLLLGRVSRLEHGAKNLLQADSWYMGFYGQDSWRLNSRLTLNAGVRWEPYFGQNLLNGAVSNFSMEGFERGIKSQVFVNAPAGLFYPGDPQFPAGRTGLNKQWWNLSPRLGLAWDVHGDGRLALRSSYSMGYDFLSGEFHNINAGAPPFGNRSVQTDPPGRMDDPYAHLGGDPHPIATNRDVQFVSFGSFGTMDPDINSNRVQSWNVTLERQLGAEWAVSAAYLGSHSDRLWFPIQLNPGIYMGLGPCTLPNGRTYPVCSINGNLNFRRALYQQNPVEAGLIGPLDLHTDVGWQNYRGIKLSAQRRAASGLSLNANYTVSRCTGTPQNPRFNQSGAGYLDPNDPSFDEGYCDQDRRHLGTLTVGYQIPELSNAALRAVVSNWRFSGILNARSGNRLNVIAGRDNAFTGIANQRPNEISDDFYEKTLTSYFNRAAFAHPPAGTLGDLPRNAVVGPAYWAIDLAMSKLVTVTASQRLELRIEAFNLTNRFNWGDPLVNFNAGTFGRITTQAGAPRIVQLGVKYDF